MNNDSDYISWYNLTSQQKRKVLNKYRVKDNEMYKLCRFKFERDRVVDSKLLKIQADFGQILLRERYVRYLVNLVSEVPYDEMLITDHASLLDTTLDSVDEIKRKLISALGKLPPCDISTPIWKMVDAIEDSQEWPSDVTQG